jgi:hypothetical protein
MAAKKKAKRRLLGRPKTAVGQDSTLSYVARNDGVKTIAFKSPAKKTTKARKRGK